MREEEQFWVHFQEPRVFMGKQAHNEAIDRTVSLPLHLSHTHAHDHTARKVTPQKTTLRLDLIWYTYIKPHLVRVGLLPLMICSWPPQATRHEI